MKVLLIILGIVLYFIIGFAVTTLVSIIANETPGEACMLILLAWPFVVVVVGIMYLNNLVDDWVLYMARKWKKWKKGKQEE